MASIRPSKRLCAQSASFSQTLLRPSISTSSPCIHATRGYSSKYDALQKEMTSRELPLIFDDLVPGHSHALNVSLSSFLPESWTPPWTKSYSKNMAHTNWKGGFLKSEGFMGPIKLSPAHHLVYFNPIIPNNKLLADGTDPLQSPGEPFVRRMWAGGYLRFHRSSAGLQGARYVCLERIRDVQVKGKEGEEKVFVGIERRIGKCAHFLKTDEAYRKALWAENEEDFAESRIIERRNIVFMRERTPEEAAAAAVAATTKMLKPQHHPDFTHTLIPTPSLLFRYSALTFNAHAIHLDPSYCRTIEGHRNLLVHGPLSLTLLVTMLKQHINGLATPEFLSSFEYRNLAPLYCGEPLKLCGRLVEPHRYELWAETPEGGIAVKGTARTVEKKKSLHRETQPLQTFRTAKAKKTKTVKEQDLSADKPTAQST